MHDIAQKQIFFFKLPELDPDPDLAVNFPDPDPAKGSGSGFGSATLPVPSHWKPNVVTYVIVMLW
jgi:hypothetical protein